MKIITIEELKKRDRVVIQVNDDEVQIHTVMTVFEDDMLIQSEESYPMDVEMDDDIVILTPIN